MNTIKSLLSVRLSSATFTFPLQHRSRVSSMSYSYISREQLSKMIVDRHPSLAIIDVRDDDHIGGHIHTSTNVPSTTLDYKIPELVRTLKDKQTVVFHCALSQQRGPTAARRYIEAREKMLEKTKAPVKKVGSGHAVAGSSTDAANTTPAETKEPQEPPKQQIYVLDGGFEKWQEKYGRDKQLTDNFAADIWVDYY